MNNPLLVAGGQPGKISVFGIVAQEDANKIILDERISVSQVPGKSSSEIVTTRISKDNVAVINSKFDAKTFEKLSADTTFVNLNCKQLDSSLIEGLTEAPSKPLSDGVLVISANTVVLCNDVQFQSLVIRFNDNLVKKGDKLKGKSAYLFMKAFVLDPNDLQVKVQIRSLDHFLTSELSAKVDFLEK